MVVSSIQQLSMLKMSGHKINRFQNGNISRALFSYLLPLRVDPFSAGSKLSGSNAETTTRPDQGVFQITSYIVRGCVPVVTQYSCVGIQFDR